MSVEKFRPEYANGKIQHEAKPYTLVLNTVLQKCTDLMALGLWCHFQSLPENWVVQVKYIQNQFGIGRDKAYSLLDKLIAMRLMDKIVIRNKAGQYGETIYVIKNGTEFIPFTENQDMESPPLPEKPYPAEPYPANQEHINKRSYTNETRTKIKQKAFSRKSVDKSKARKLENETKHPWAAMKNEKAAIDQHQRLKQEACSPEARNFVRQLCAGVAGDQILEGDSDEIDWGNDCSKAS